MYTFPEPKFLKVVAVFMTRKRSRRKPDPLAILVIAVVLGMSLTLAYQVNLYYGAQAIPIANQPPEADGLSR